MTAAGDQGRHHCLHESLVCLTQELVPGQYNQWGQRTGPWSPGGLIPTPLSRAAAAADTIFSVLPSSVAIILLNRSVHPSVALTNQIYVNCVLPTNCPLLVICSSSSLPVHLSYAHPNMTPPPLLPLLFLPLHTSPLPACCPPCCCQQKGRGNAQGESR